jgi:LacI family transcriptional regulator
MNTPRKAPTIYDVAALAGVAPSTVSRALSKPGRVAFATAEKIRAAAEELGYRSERLNRKSGATTKIIALIVADITNPAYFDMIRGAEQAAAQRGYILLLANGEESERREEDAVNRSLDLVDGVILASPRMPDAAVRDIAKRKATVVMNRPVRGVASVLPDNRKGMELAVEHLKSTGRSSILFLAGPEASWAGSMRWRGAMDAALASGLTIHRTDPIRPTLAGGAGAVGLWMARRTTAVIAYNDLMAMGFMQGLRARGVRVPDDVAVVGFDNAMGSEIIHPGLTTVESPLFMLGATAAQNVIAIHRGAKSSLDQPVMLPSRLVVRGSA